MTAHYPEQRIAIPALGMAWLRIAFVHWAYPPDAVQRLLPAGLTVDQYAGRAWVGLTPFTMARVRVAALLPLASETFRETNVRTYVRGPHGRDGLWFFSLDATHLPFIVAANALLGAPYRLAHLEADEAGGLLDYHGRRMGRTASYRVSLRPGPRLVPDGLEVWLTSRWRAYTHHLGVLWDTPVDHEPWPLRGTTDHAITQDMTGAAGLPDPADAPLVHFSDGVRRVRFGLTRPAR
ncbi:YqjF family protein [Kitasatospora sp. NPDC054939]